MKYFYNEICGSSRRCFRTKSLHFRNKFTKDWNKDLNMLLLNKHKTDTTLFRTKQNKVKLSGVNIDEFLDWSKHISFLVD